jgi:hypothetical protein
MKKNKGKEFDFRNTFLKAITLIIVLSVFLMILSLFLPNGTASNFFTIFSGLLSSLAALYISLYIVNLDNEVKNNENKRIIELSKPRLQCDYAMVDNNDLMILNEHFRKIDYHLVYTNEPYEKLANMFYFTLNNYGQRLTFIDDINISDLDPYNKKYRDINSNFKNILESEKTLDICIPIDLTYLKKQVSISFFVISENYRKYSVNIRFDVIFLDKAFKPYLTIEYINENI